jgi:uncharacterized protein (DUF433 family)
MISKRLSVRLEFSIIETEIKHTPGVCGGDARIRNTRIPVWTLVSLRQQGATDSDQLAAYPSLIQSDLEKSSRSVNCTYVIE